MDLSNVCLSGTMNKELTKFCRLPISLDAFDHFPLSAKVWGISYLISVRLVKIDRYAFFYIPNLGAAL